MGYRVCRDRAKGSAQSIDEIKRAVEGKKADKKMLQKNVAEKIRERRKDEYKA